MSRSNVRKAQIRFVDSMVDIKSFRNYACSQCNKAMGSIGVRGISFRTNAQHMGDIVVELQCPHCDSGYDLHYRGVVKSMSQFATLLMDMSTSGCVGLQGEPIHPSINPIKSYEIKPQDNNLISLIMAESMKPKGKRSSATTGRIKKAVKK